MCVHRRGLGDEARSLATETAARLRPPPADGQYPLVDGADHDDLVLWLAFREAKALIGLNAPPPPRQDRAGNDRELTGSFCEDAEIHGEGPSEAVIGALPPESPRPLNSAALAASLI